MSKEIDISELEWRFVWHGSGGKDLWNRRGGRICIGGANYNELLYVGENQFDLDNAESLIAKHNSDLLAVAQSKNAEIEKLKAENERLKAGDKAREADIQAVCDAVLANEIDHHGYTCTDYCTFCSVRLCRGEKHRSDCAVLIAQDLMTGYQEQTK